MTKIIEINENEAISLYMNDLEAAGKILAEGGTVVFPTETVYGLGANALTRESAAKIYVAKNRPADNPLIVHIGHQGDVEALTKNISDMARQLMAEFWPGPLTLIFDKSEIIPEIVSGGLETVAVRMPANPIALELIRQSGVPVAAPSANLSGKPSPTTGKHVVEDMDGRVDCIIISGKANVGLESTVLDVRGPYPIILRPGGVTKEHLEKLVGRVDVDPALEEKKEQDTEFQPMSPGMKYKHYAPEAEVVVIDARGKGQVEIFERLVREYTRLGKSVGLMCSEECLDDISREIKNECNIKITGSIVDLERVATNIFSYLRDFDEDGTDVILAEAYDNKGIGKAIMNRLNKAAGFNIVSC